MFQFAGFHGDQTGPPFFKIEKMSNLYGRKSQINLHLCI